MRLTSPPVLHIEPPDLIPGAKKKFQIKGCKFYFITVSKEITKERFKKSALYFELRASYLTPTGRFIYLRKSKKK